METMPRNFEVKGSDGTPDFGIPVADGLYENAPNIR
jgi:hypothetical protein